MDLMVLSLSSWASGRDGSPPSPHALAALANDRLEAEVLKNPSRFAGLVAVSMHNPATGGRGAGGGA